MSPPQTGPRDAVIAAERAYALAVRSFDAAHMRFVIADAHLEALLLASRISEAGCLAEGLRREAATLSGAAMVFSNALAGRTALTAGHLQEADALLQPAVDLLIAVGESNGFGHRYRLPTIVSLAIQARYDNAAAALAVLERCRHPSWRNLDYEYELAQAWVAACQEAVSQAVGIALASAEMCCVNGQFAAEALFADRCTVRRQRLRSPPAGAAVARGGRSHRSGGEVRRRLSRGDGAALAAVSEQYEQIGDLVAAVEAASHAASVYRRDELRGSALTCGARAAALANSATAQALQRCGRPGSGCHSPNAGTRSRCCSRWGYPAARLRSG
ncbi:hypothetical protein [Mycobacterium attenuatum]|uniref:hypothetical protein n=1 Tax=Mycobacterium attenuatum TaxID=2341086 RepID=UPI0010A96FEE|nr:hypothetical protein [Mycobacterium attenuatum]